MMYELMCMHRKSSRRNIYGGGAGATCFDAWRRQTSVCAALSISLT